MKSFKSGKYVNQGSYKSFQPNSIVRPWQVDSSEVLNLLSQADRDLGRLDMFSHYVPNIDLFISMHVYGGLAAPLAVLAILALCGFLALYYAAAGYFYKRFRQVAGINPAWSAIVFAAAWMLAELARDSWFTGFPWGAGGYAHVDGPFAWIASWAGVYAVGATGAFVAGSDNLIDSVVAYGTSDKIATCLREHLDAGADHVRAEGLEQFINAFRRGQEHNPNFWTWGDEVGRWHVFWFM